MKSALLACLLLGCASTARLTGSFDDYAAYRRARVAITREERLGASFDYLQAFPRGDFRPEIRAWFVPAEARYFRLAQESPDRLRAYLKVMPHGPHAAQVAERLAELDTRRVFAARREERALSRARDVQVALVDAESSRRNFVREWVSLVALLARVRTFGEPTSALESELIWQFRLREPYGHCALDHCQKSFRFAYAVPGDKQLVQRSAELSLELELERGELRSVALVGREQFSRLAEAVEVRALGSGAADRALALQRAVALVGDAVASSFPEASCAARAEGEYLLARQCAGVRLELETTSDGLDLLRVTPVAHRF